MRLILASASPRRAEILRDAGMAFEVCASNMAEDQLPGESAEQMVSRLAKEKACAVAAQQTSGNAAIIVGADTCVELGGEIFGKPRDAADARAMLTRLAGRTHRVVTGICAIRVPDAVMRSAVEITAVTFAPLDESEIAVYVASGEPMDKAGAYAIQGRAGRHITRIEGCYFNVVGLPLARLCSLLKKMGWTDMRDGIL
jgi:septum formation protein